MGIGPEDDDVLSFEQIKELIELVGSHKLQGVELERSGFRLTIEGQSTGGGPSVTTTPAAAALPAALPAPTPTESTESIAEPATDEPVEPRHVLTSPIVGTFYRKPNPDAPVYVEVGDRVKKGQVLCIVEAMKLMNEIESDIDGVVREILPKDAQAVEYGEPLFSIFAD